MALILGGVRRLRRKFAFTVQLDGQVEPFEIECDTAEVAYRRIEELKAAASGRAPRLSQLSGG